ncbi:hypothetical protein [Streptomyces sp. NPDC056323]
MSRLQVEIVSDGSVRHHVLIDSTGIAKGLAGLTAHPRARGAQG